MLTEKQIWDSDVLMAANSRAGMHMADFTALVRTVESVVTSRVEAPLLARIAELEAVLKRQTTASASVLNEKQTQIAELEAKLAQVEQDAQPVAWSTFDGEGGCEFRDYEGNENYRDEYEKRNPRHKNWVQPLYTSPPKQVPLTDEQIDAELPFEEMRDGDCDPRDFVRGVRFAERFHNIGTAAPAKTQGCE